MPHKNQTIHNLEINIRMNNNVTSVDSLNDLLCYFKFYMNNDSHSNFD